jgi:hypothetical protein
MVEGTTSVIASINELITKNNNGSYVIYVKRNYQLWSYINKILDVVENYGYHTLFITRMNQSRVARNVLHSINIMYWLAMENGENIIKPTEYSIIQLTMEDFIGIHKEKSIIICEGLEYLIFYNGFEKIYKMVSRISDVVYNNNSIFFLLVDYNAFNNKELSLLETSFQPLTTEFADKEATDTTDST